TAGLYAAELLAENGLETAVFEREEAVNPARRTYIITKGLRRVLGEIPPSWICHRVDRLAVAAQGVEQTLSLKDPDLVMERNQLTQALADRAREAGAGVFLGLDFQGFRESEQGTQLVFIDRDGDERVMSSPVVIGADGAFSRVAKAAGLPRPAAVPLLQAEVNLPEGWDPGLTKVWFDVGETRYFFWLIPESSSRAVVGLIGNPGSDLRAVLDRFLDSHHLTADGYQAGQAAMHHPSLRPWGRVGESRVLLVGDAAGQVKVTTVGGTVTGLWGARAAAEAVLEDKAYEDTVRPLQRELDVHWRIRELLESMGEDGYQKLISLISPGVKKFLARYDRDAMKGKFWNLPFIQPRFIPLGFKLYFRFLRDKLMKG
ncbi:MAG: NAD(P)/FAD-dependent oxidoreductase, partial [Anaerolineales bacterium]|nr:NAD(P)/FAD-dependent oxidoreductase [Anaerolineales bacterium]